jgi:hypothetical protein
VDSRVNTVFVALMFFCDYELRSSTISM